MGFFDKLAFWKKKDDLADLGKDFGFDKDLGMDLGQGPSADLGMGLEPSSPQQSFNKYPSFQQQQSFQQQPAFAQPSYTSDSNYIASKNMEVISSKLDALRVSLESINQRLSNIEAIARGEQEDTRRKRYY